MLRTKFEETIILTGKGKATVRDAKTGRILKVVPFKNLVVTAGKEHVAKLLVGVSSSFFKYVQPGSSTQAPAVGDTDLISPIGSRKIVTKAWTSGAIAKFSTFFGAADNNGTWNECGLFELATGGAMLARALFSATITKDSTKTVTVDWEITVS